VRTSPPEKSTPGVDFDDQGARLPDLAVSDFIDTRRRFFVRFACAARPWRRSSETSASR
jgi:hypothetical protein